ncbi:DUF4345 domain-containing protein [Mesorhizobium sp. LNHC209A00]|uniref:DUF4345 domain-containing protein n=1 Tax=Mesorhizobium TaxID=68287 RepID=UPI00041CD3AC|nr:DUF4345 domain-containing protein [Mesorhizobium sp. LNHC209A00]
MSPHHGLSISTVISASCPGFPGHWPCSCIPSIETKTERFRLLAACTFAGGLARLVSLLLVGAPSLGHVAGLCIELLAVPALVWWQGHVVNKASGTGQFSGA